MKFLFLGILLAFLSCANKPKPVETSHVYKTDDYYVIKVDTLDYVGEGYRYKRITYWLEMAQ